MESFPKRSNFLDPSAVDKEDNAAEEQQVFTLYQNKPNPFNPATVISYMLNKNSDVTLTVHDALGQRVRTLAEGTMSAGNHEIRWDGCDESGKQVSSGIYICRINADGHTGAIGMTLVR